ncbi:MAG: response regulator [Deltaproteobacteria bacterium]|nr:response regulator [Deltaproteobacteria bacterium]
MTKLVLVLVDDDALLLRVLLRGIGDAVEVVGAADAETAKAIINGRRVDVVVSDFNMAGGTGVQLLKWVRDHHHRIGRVLMSGFPQQLVADGVVAAEIAHAVLQKPFETDELLAVVKSVAPFRDGTP